MSVQDREQLAGQETQTPDDTLQYINAAQKLRTWLDRHWEETPEGQKLSALEQHLPPGHPMLNNMQQTEELAKEFAIQRILSRSDPDHIQCFLQVEENKTFQEAAEVIGPVLAREMHLFMLTELPRQMAGFGDYYSSPQYQQWQQVWQGPQGKQQGGSPDYGGGTTEGQ